MGETGCKSRPRALTEDTGVLRSACVSANAAAVLLVRELLARVSLLTGSAGGGTFSLPNRGMTVACGGTTTDGVATVGVDVIFAANADRRKCSLGMIPQTTVAQQGARGQELP